MCQSHFKWPDSEVREIRDAVSSDSRFTHGDPYTAQSPQNIRASQAYLQCNCCALEFNHENGYKYSSSSFKSRNKTTKPETVRSTRSDQ